MILIVTYQSLVKYFSFKSNHEIIYISYIFSIDFSCVNASNTELRCVPSLKRYSAIVLRRDDGRKLRKGCFSR